MGDAGIGEPKIRRLPDDAFQGSGATTVSFCPKVILSASFTRRAAAFTCY